MADVAKHHAKEEWVSDDGEGRRVDLAATRDTIPIHNPLKSGGELILAKVGWRLLVRLYDVDNAWHLRARSRRAAPYGRLRLLITRDGAPRLGNQTLSRQVIVPHIEYPIDGLLLQCDAPPLGHLLRELR